MSTYNFWRMNVPTNSSDPAPLTRSEFLIACAVIAAIVAANSADSEEGTEGRLTVEAKKRIAWHVKTGTSKYQRESMADLMNVIGWID